MMKTTGNVRILAKNQYIDNNTRRTGINNNDLIIGPSGSGKTRYYVKPNIMQCNGSMIVADTKGNLHEQVGPVLEKNGYQIKVIDFKDLGNSYGYNPFDFIRFDQERQCYNEQDIITIANVISPVRTLKDPFWDNAGKLYLSCFISFVLEELNPAEHHLCTVDKLLASFTSNPALLDNMMIDLERKNPESFAVHQFKKFSCNTKAEKTHQCILGILAEKLNVLTLPCAKKLYTNKKSIDFRKIAQSKTALFLTISDVDRSMDILCNLFYTQALQILTRIADEQNSGRLPVPIRFFLDDFATNTLIPDFDNIISVIRSREIYVSIILQSITQLSGLYGGEKSLTIINNCDNCLYLGGQDMNTANFIAQKANLPVNQVLNMELSEAFLFSRGKIHSKVEKYDITSHPEYPILPEAIYVEQRRKLLQAQRKEAQTA